MALFITYLAIKYARRARFVRLLRVAHISPDEYTSTRAALLVKQYGIHRVRPLAGGYETWRQKNFPLTPAAVPPRTVPLLPFAVTMTS